MLKLIDKILFMLFVICGLLTIIFLFCYIFTDEMKYQGLSIISLISTIVFNEIENKIINKLLEEDENE